VVVSSCIGALYHLYQGPLGALIVLCSSLLFGAVFVLRRSIWPVAAAHVALDLLLV
jgi:membrane protease YdiL (CAAX protease family)